MQPAIWRTHGSPVAEREDRAITRREGGRRRRSRWWRRRRSREAEEASDGRGRRGGGGSGGGGGEGKRSSSVKHMTRIERTNRHSALRPRYTANMAAEGRIGGGQPRRQPMSSWRPRFTQLGSNSTDFVRVGPYGTPPFRAVAAHPSSAFPPHRPPHRRVVPSPKLHV